MDNSIRLTPVDFLDYNGIIFSHYDDRKVLEPFFEYASDASNHMCGGVPTAYVKEVVQHTTHAFIAWVKHDGPEGGRIPVAYALFGPDAGVASDTIVLQLVCSRPLAQRSERDKHSEAFWSEWQGYGDLEYEDDPEAAFALRGKSYATFRSQWAKVCSYSKERRALVLGLGIILICEAMTYFTGYKHMRLEAAKRDLIPYYARFGFEEAATGATCGEDGVIRYLQGTGGGSSTTASGSTNMLLCDLHGKGQQLACEWAKRYMQREFCPEFWDAIRHSGAWQEARTYALTQQPICVSCMMKPAPLECGAPGCGGPGASYCGIKCQRTHWLEGKHSLVCGELTKRKAREILHHGTVRGHPLTERQRRFFGWKSSQK